VLRIEVRDSGIGLQAHALAAREGSGFGVAQVRERLAAAHGTRGTLQMASLPEGGTCAAVELPLAFAAASEEAAAPAAPAAAPPHDASHATHATPP